MVLPCVFILDEHCAWSCLDKLLDVLLLLLDGKRLHLGRNLRQRSPAGPAEWLDRPRALLGAASSSALWLRPRPAPLAAWPGALILVLHQVNGR